LRQARRGLWLRRALLKAPQPGSTVARHQVASSVRMSCIGGFPTPSTLISRKKYTIRRPPRKRGIDLPGMGT
jgi:hypothetical protein